MFIRALRTEEVDLIRLVEGFVRDATGQKHRDPSQTFEAVRLALEIGQKIPYPVNPLVLILTAMFHELGVMVSGESPISGFMGASLAESFMRVTTISDLDRLQVSRAICKCATSDTVPVETHEQMVVADAQRLNRMGMVSVIHWLTDHPENPQESLQVLVEHRQTDFEALHFEESRSLGQPLLDQTRILVESLGRAYQLRPMTLDQIELPIM